MRTAKSVTKGALDFEGVLQNSKASILDIEWYPYHALAAIGFLSRLTPGSGHVSVIEFSGGLPILDIGCADGEASFFLESLGYMVRAVDYSETNLNGMRGVRALREKLGSKVEIIDRNLDSNPHLPGPAGLALALGLAYHLANPFQFLEALSRSAHFAAFSTRVLDISPGGLDWRKESAAYLVGRTELQGDVTNYWVFSELGWLKLLDRAGWDVVSTASSGASRGDLGDRDRRVFCLARSRHIGAPVAIALGKGWHALEEGAWRWTEPRFSLIAQGWNESHIAAERVHLDFYLPTGSGEERATRTLTCKAYGEVIGRQTYQQAGSCVFTSALPAALQFTPSLELEFELDCPWKPALGTDDRELGLVVAGFDAAGDATWPGFGLKLF